MTAAPRMVAPKLELLISSPPPAAFPQLPPDPTMPAPERLQFQNHPLLDIVSGARRSESPFALDLGFTFLGLPNNSVASVYYCEQLMAHAASLSLALNFVPVDDAPAVGERTLCCSPFHGRSAVLVNGVHDLEAAASSLRGWLKSHAYITTQYPSGRKRD